jgi:hypothetical protein
MKKPNWQRQFGTFWGRLSLLGTLLFLVGCAPTEVEPTGDSDDAEVPRGLRVTTAAASDGYVYFSPLLSDTTYLINLDGQVVHTWKSDYAPSGGLYLLDNGHLLRPAREPDVAVFNGGGQGGRIQEFSWEGELVWDWLFASEKHLLHHDIEPLPNGNILAIAWEAKTVDEVRAAGRRPELIPEGGLWPDMVVEIQPLPPNDARIVWEWHVWDHLIQNHDPKLRNYGDPSEHPERIDINGGEEPPELDPEELKRLQALGYVPPDADAEELRSDFLHTNSVAYNSVLDQIALSVPRFNEIWVIDHSTTTVEAAGSSGGRWGRGGDLLHRWGNPQVYGRGDEKDQQLFAQHDARWVADSMPDGGNLMIFNNDLSGPEGDYSAVIEISLPTDANGRYVLQNGPFGPLEPVWTYQAPDGTSFHSSFISGAHRLANGHTLITSGAQGRFFEVTLEGEIVWEYWDPHSGQVRMADGSTPHPVGENTYAVFRATKLPPDHLALSGRRLQPLDPQPAIAPPSEESP